MESTINTLSKTYDDFVAAIAGVLEARASSAGERTPATDAATEHFRDQLVLFHASCDNAEDFIGSLTRWIAWDATAAADLTTTPPPTDASEAMPDNGGSPRSAADVPGASPPPISDEMSKPPVEHV